MVDLLEGSDLAKEMFRWSVDEFSPSNGLGVALNLVVSDLACLSQGSTAAASLTVAVVLNAVKNLLIAA